MSAFLLTSKIKAQSEGVRLFDGISDVLVSYGPKLPALSGEWQPYLALITPEIFVWFLTQNGNYTAWALNRDGELIAISADEIEGLIAKQARLAGSPADLTTCSTALSLLRLPFDKSQRSALPVLVLLLSLEESNKHLLQLLASVVDDGSGGDLTHLAARLRPELIQDAVVTHLYAVRAKRLTEQERYDEAVRMFTSAYSGNQEMPAWARAYAWHSAYRIDMAHPWRTEDNLGDMFDAMETTLGTILGGRNCAWDKPCGPSLLYTSQWVASRVREAHVPQDGGKLEDVAEALLDYGVSPDFIALIEQGAEAVDHRVLDYSLAALGHSGSSASARVAEVAATVALGGKPILDPFTGTIQVCRDTVDHHCFLLRSNDRACIVLSDPDISLAPSDRAWFFPDLKIVVSVGYYGTAKRDVAIAAGRILDNFDIIPKYLSSSDRIAVIQEVLFNHIGHYVWNVVSGWEHFFEIVPPDAQFALVQFEGQHLFGGVRDLYADECKRLGGVAMLIDPEQALRSALASNQISVILRDQNPSPGLARRIVAWCRERSGPDFLRQLAEFRSGVERAIMITLRFDNRCWIEQEAGYIAIINEFAKGNRSLGVVFDGLNYQPEGATTWAPMSLETELACANRIMAACSSVRFLNTIGSTVPESIVACDAIDFFLAPVGAGLAKVRWIANKPGVAFSNTTFLQPGSFEGYLYSHYRSDLVPMSYVDATDVVDADSGQHGMISRANFHMDWSVIWKKVPLWIRD